VKSVRVELAGAAYTVAVGRGLIDRAGALLHADLPAGRVLLVSDVQVAGLYFERAAAALRAAGYAVESTVVPAGEQSKSLASYGRLLETMARARLDRADAVVALGGGVVSDLTGFAAATYRRGLAWAVLPTTLVAMVDAGIGGKTAINLPQGKNLVGCFHQPRAVVCDLDLLRTLPAEQWIEGLAEVAKIAILLDPDLFARLEAEPERGLAGDLDYLEPIAVRAAELKAAVVARDPQEAGERALLNLGHTFAHGLEAARGPRPAHGIAVLLGLIAAARLARALEALSMDDARRIEALAGAWLRRVPLPPLDLERAWEAMGSDKKTVAGRMRLVVPRAIGRAELRSDVAADAARAALDSLAEL
jgi:3-dehydroquinate synthase